MKKVKDPGFPNPLFIKTTDAWSQPYDFKIYNYSPTVVEGWCVVQSRRKHF
jgi:hypothetical protein